MDDKYKKVPPKRKAIEKEGVIYTPSGLKPDDLKSTRVISPVRDRKVPPPPPKGRPPARSGTAKPTSRSGFVLFFVTTVFVGVLVCIFVFAMVFNTVINSDRNASGGGSGETGAPLQTPSGTVPLPLEDGVILAMITHINPDSKKLTLYNLETEEESGFYVEGSTELRDKYGSSLVFGEFKMGDVVEAVFPSEDTVLTSLKISPQAVIYKNISDVSVDKEGKTITIGNDKFTYGGETICVYNQSDYDISSIHAVDLLNIHVYKGRAVYVEIAKSHGGLKIATSKDIINGSVEIDTNVYALLENFTEIELQEGVHKVVIKGSNIEPYVEEATILSGESYELKMDDIVFKAGVLTVKVIPGDATLTINGQAMLTGEPLVLEYGDYVIKVEKEGYAASEQQITFDKPQDEMTITLEEEVKTCNLKVTTDPSGASVYVDNTYIGLSPITVSVEYGPHSITVKKEGYAEVTVPLNVNTEALNPDIQLIPQEGIVIPE